MTYSYDDIREQVIYGVTTKVSHTHELMSEQVHAQVPSQVARKYGLGFDNGTIFVGDIEGFVAYHFEGT